MKRVAVAAALVVLAACGGGADEGTIEACGMALAVTMPGEGTTLGAPDAWKAAAQKAADAAGDERVKRTGMALAAALSHDYPRAGFSEAQLERYTKAALAFRAACNESGAYEDERFKGGPR